MHQKKSLKSKKFCLSLHAENRYLFVNGKEIFNFMANNKNVNFPTFIATESREEFLNGNMYGFSVDYSFIDKCDILKIHKYLMTKNGMKY